MAGLSAGPGLSYKVTGRGGGGAIMVPDDQIFPGPNKAACESDRDDFFTTNPEKLVNKALCVLQPADLDVPILQEYRADEWVDITIVIVGPPGPVPSGVMLKSVYDIDDNGSVDAAEKVADLVHLREDATAGTLVAFMDEPSVDGVPSVYVADKDAPFRRPAFAMTIVDGVVGENVRAVEMGLVPYDTSQWAAGQVLSLGINGGLEADPDGYNQQIAIVRIEGTNGEVHMYPGGFNFAPPQAAPQAPLSFDNLFDTPPSKEGANKFFVQVDEASGTLVYTEVTPGEGVQGPEGAESNEIASFDGPTGQRIVGESDVSIHDGIIERITAPSRLWIKASSGHKLVLGNVDLSEGSNNAHTYFTSGSTIAVALVTTGDNSQYIEFIKQGVSRGSIGSKRDNGALGLYHGDAQVGSVHRFELLPDGTFIARGGGDDTVFKLYGLKPSYELRGNTGGFIGSLSGIGGELVLTMSETSKLILNDDGTEVIGKLSIGTVVPSEDYALLLAGGAFGLAKFTTEERDALDVEDGALIENTDTGQREVYRGEAWKADAAEGSGDVQGPDGAEVDELATYQNISGKLLQGGSGVKAFDSTIEGTVLDKDLLIKANGNGAVGAVGAEYSRTDPLADFATFFVGDSAQAIFSIISEMDEMKGISFQNSEAVTAGILEENNDFTLINHISGKSFTMNAEGQYRFDRLMVTGNQLSNRIEGSPLELLARGEGRIFLLSEQISLGKESEENGDIYWGAGFIIRDGKAFRPASITQAEQAALEDVPPGGIVYNEDQGRINKYGEKWTSFVEIDGDGEEGAIPTFVDGNLIEASSIKVVDGVLTTDESILKLGTDKSRIDIGEHLSVYADSVIIGEGSVSDSRNLSFALVEPDKAMILNRISMGIDFPVTAMLAYSPYENAPVFYNGEDWIPWGGGTPLKPGFEVIIGGGTIELDASTDVFDAVVKDLEGFYKLREYKKAGVSQIGLEEENFHVDYDQASGVFTMPADAPDGYYQCSVQFSGKPQHTWGFSEFAAFKGWFSVNNRRWDVTPYDLPFTDIDPNGMGAQASALIHIKPGETVSFNYDAFYSGNGEGDDWLIHELWVRFNFVRPRT